MRLQIVCRGSTGEGLGHLFRTKTFAGAASRRHEVEVIAIVEAGLEVIFAELSCPVVMVRDDADALPYVDRFHPEILLFDLTRIDGNVFREAKGLASLTASLSPVFDQMAGVDLLFTRYARTDPLAGVRVFAGLEYAVFSESCTVIDDLTFERNLMRRELPVAVCMGGADAANKTARVLQALTQIEESCTIWVLLGEGYSHSYNALVDSVRDSRQHEIILAKTNRSMWRVMASCAAAILAGGLTTVEAVYAGLPSINLFERQEHQQVTRELFDLGVCLDGGLFSEDSLALMVETLRRLHRHRDLLREMHRRCRGLVDDRGSERVLLELERQLAGRTGVPATRQAARATRRLERAR